MRVTHDPDTTLDYKIEWGVCLLPGETITSFTLVVDPNDGDLQILSSSNLGDAVILNVTGGRLGRSYDVLNHVVTSGGREYEDTLVFVVRDKPVPTTPGGCEWPVDYAECGPCDALSSLPPSGVRRFEDMAVEFLWRWTQKQFGICEATIRPCRQDCLGWASSYHGATGQPPGRGPFVPTLVRGQWLNLGCGRGCGDSCGCSANRALRFEIPVYEVAEVQVDGAYLDPSTYRLSDQGRFLVRQDGGQWPYCQDMGRPLGDPDTWAVTVRVGSPVPAGGRVAAGKLACELAKAACGASGCELPSRVQSITRQGVSISMMLDTFDDLDKGRTGVWLIDSWVSSVTRPDIGFSIASPDYRPTGRGR